VRRLIALGALLRISLAPTAAADILAGVVVAARAFPFGAAPWLLVVASLCVFHGGMALNDWADLERDRRGRRDRPLVRRELAPSTALGVALGLLLLGPLLAAFAHPHAGIMLGGASLCAVLYDLGPRGPWLGPLLLAACRVLNLGAGLALGRALAETPPSLPSLLAPAFAYAIYVGTLGRLSRLEDGADSRPLERRPAFHAAVLSGVLLALPALAVAEDGPRADEPIAEDLAGLLLSTRVLLSALLAAVGAFGLLRLAFRIRPWRRADVVEAMGMGLRRLLILSSTLALTVGTPSAALVALGILAGYPLAFALRAMFPPS
jgi:4-hydroxybenzoate polyprenyltransferase